MSKCEKCCYYYNPYKKCYNGCGRYVDCKENCDRFELRAVALKPEELEKFSCEDLIEQYKANYKYTQTWSDSQDGSYGACYADYVAPLKIELEKRGYEVNRNNVAKAV